MKVKKVIRLMDIQDKLSNISNSDMERLSMAYVYAAKKHFGQLRQSGEPYLSHPLSVAYILADMNMDIDSIIAGMLHDTLEDTDATKEELKSLFGNQIAFLVDGLTKIARMEFKSKEEKQAENFRKMLISTFEDIRVILIKLADRLHNMRTIESLRPDKQKRIAEETLGIYAPLAHRLGIAWMKWELEDLAFQAISPTSYNEIQQSVRLNRDDRERYIEKVKQSVLEAISKDGINAEINGRPKHFYSIYSKMQKKNTTFEEIYDLLALRVIVDSISQCYAVMGVIHHIFKPIPSRFKDYIAMPKANMYQSLHTTVMGPDGHIVEFQIRTKQMHRIAEEGIAAHWKYKEGKAFDPKADSQFVWLRQLVEQKDKDSSEIVETLKEDVLPSQLYVFTPAGDILELPEGATPIDFAYAIHSEVGNKCIGAKVNGKIVHLRYRLQMGDKVEIITSPNQEPRKDWLSFVRTSRTKTRIRAYLRKKDSDRAYAKGLSMLEQLFKEHNLVFKDIVEDTASVVKLLDKLGQRSLDDVIINIGFSMLTPRKVLHAMFPSFAKDGDQDDANLSKPSGHIREPFIIDGIDGIMVKVARCCTPLPGDKVVGYISTGRGIIVHKSSCHNLKHTAISAERILPVRWNEDKNYKAPVRFLAYTSSRTGLINAITSEIKDLKLNIIEYAAKPLGGGESEHRFSVEVGTTAEIEQLLTKINNIKGVKSVRVC